MVFAVMRRTIIYACNHKCPVGVKRCHRRSSESVACSCKINLGLKLAICSIPAVNQCTIQQVPEVSGVASVSPLTPFKVNMLKTMPHSLMQFSRNLVTKSAEEEA